MDPEKITLRPTTESDLPTFFLHQSDPLACHMAAFTAKDPTNLPAFNTHWHKLLSDPSITPLTILLNNHTIAGHLAAFGPPDGREITYWLGREFWNQHIATRALQLFLPQYPARPLHARAAADNLPSLRVLQNCGFRPTGTSRFHANARHQEIEEILLTLP